MPSRRMLRHMRVLIKSAGGKFERSSEKREGNNEENGYKSLTCTYSFLFYSPTSCRSYLSAYEFCRRGFNKQIYSKVYFLPNSSEATSGHPEFYFEKHGWTIFETPASVLTYAKLQVFNRSDKGLTLETSAFSPFTVANLRFQPSC